MTEQYRPSLSELVEGQAFRDAVHIAVAPVVAGIYLNGPIPDWDRFSFGCSC
jgi:hypothetical protein